MSSDVVIRAEGLGKKYMLGHQSGERYTSLRDVMARTARNFARTAGDILRGKAIIAGDEVEEFWALKDISFEIKRGDVVGIIGRNGAGKSTLLKVLSRITEPSEGRVEVKGRIASLLEVGTGFHPELTGRENIYLNGAILGMSRAEIKRKFDEIVDFSGVEKFLDTPVKRYSSGMYVRLAFAVAAHLEPEILIVDEVLAVGDAEFQKKCLGKMGDVASEGRTVLFVSHNMGAVKSLCPSSILLAGGRIEASGDTHRMTDLYTRKASNLGSKVSKKTGPFSVSITGVSLSISDPAAIQIFAEVGTKEPIDAELRCLLRTNYGAIVGIGSVGGFGAKPLVFEAGRHDVEFSLEMSNMAADLYNIEFELVSAASGKVLAADAAMGIDFAPQPLPGDVIYLRGEWAFGHIRFPSDCRLESTGRFDLLNISDPETVKRNSIKR
jgi:ABC-type polysaccharide/polyol phosphate transport system ATPase subunit